MKTYRAALAAGFALLCILFAMVAVQDAFAQTVVSSAPTSLAPPAATWEASIALIRDSMIATILAVIAGVISWLSSLAPAWARALIDKATTSEAVNWEDYVSTALGKAFDVAAAKVGATPENLASAEQKADFMGWAVGTLRKYNKDIVSFLDKDGNGVVDLVELELAKRGASPKLFAGTEEAQAAPMARRSQRTAAMPDATLAKFAPKGRA